jgi:hypothetical protein
MKKAAVLAATLPLTFAALLLTSRTQQSKDKSAVPPELQIPKPGPEMEKLKFLIGTWETKGGYEKSPMFPAGGEQIGWYKAQLGPGGFSILADFEADGPLGKEIGHEIITWDPKQNVYTTIVVGNAFPGANIGTSKWEGAELVTVHEFDYNGTKIHLRSAITKIRDNSVHMEESSQTGDGAALPIWKADAVKK